jgi:hypothetical protein
MPKPTDPAAAEKLAAYLAGRRDLKPIERSNAGKVLRRFAKQLLPLGYRRKSTFFAREAGHIIQFLHLHKFSFGPNFRMHVCIRVLNETWAMNPSPVSLLHCLVTRPLPTWIAPAHAGLNRVCVDHSNQSPMAG